MRATFARLLIPSLVLSLVGCGAADNPFPRVEYPSTPGNFVQFYLDGGAVVAEIAKVDVRGVAVTLKSSGWHGGKVRLESGVSNQTAAFPECGVLLSFKEHPNRTVTTSPIVSSEVAKKSCPLGPLPVEWKRVGHEKAGS